METLKLIILTVLLYSCVCDGYKILLVFPVPAKSHGILGETMVKHLLDAGHEVTYVTPFPYKEPRPKQLKIVDVAENSKNFNENFINIKMIMDGEIDFQNADVMSELMIGMAAATLQNPKLQTFLRDPTQTFDVVIGEWMFSELYSVFPAIYDCPLIWFSTIEPHWLVTNLVDGPLNPAYNCDYLHGRIAPYGFLERANELWTQARIIMRQYFKYYYMEEDVYLKYIVPILQERGKAIPYYNDLKYNASLLLGNTNVAIGEPTSLPQNYKHIGGYHIQETVQPLPENLKKIIDNAKHGVIYFSMGSNIKSKDLPDELKKNLLNVFRGLKQTVLWKFEEVLADLPKNVHIVSWAPQQSILAHPNVILFVTHGGLLSITETVHYGVPVISIPVFADQFYNSLRAESKGFGKKVDLTYTMPEQLKGALDEVLNNPKYTAKAKEVSVAYHDRTMAPKEELNFWIQHVIRTRGAPHLRSPALRVPLYQRIYLDLLAAAIVVITVLTVSLKKAFSLLNTKKSSKKEKRN